MDNYSDVFIVAIVFFSFVGVVKVISDNRIRQKLIDKGELGEKVKYLYSNSTSRTLSSLKWGFVLIGLGLALLIGQLLPVDVQEEVVVGAMFILAGSGLLLFYYIASKLGKKSNQE
ncbi:hypothetical protein JW835_14485 [bacterium]|nr:hypothetical protein [bacterium]